jgi:hypothetical protein
MIIEIVSFEPALAMLLQNNLWDDISTFLHLLLDPIINALQDVALRHSILSTIIWSTLIICGLIFVTYEFPIVITLITGSQPKSRRQRTTSSAASKTQTESSSARLRRESQDKIQEESEKREKAVLKTGVNVTAKIVQERELMRLTVTIRNGSTSHIDMVVVDLNLPFGIDAETGSFRMQRLGTINSGETKSADFLLRPMGGDPRKIGGHVEFLGASYEVSKIPIPPPEMEGMTSE